MLYFNCWVVLSERNPHVTETHFQSCDNIPLGQFPEHQAEICIHQVVYLLRAVDSGDITQL